MPLLKVKKRDYVNKAMSPPTFSCCCRNLKSKKTIDGASPLVEMTMNSMEQKSQLLYVQEYPL